MNDSPVSVDYVSVSRKLAVLANTALSKMIERTKSDNLYVYHKPYAVPLFDEGFYITAFSESTGLPMEGCVGFSMAGFPDDRRSATGLIANTGMKSLFDLKAV